VPGKTPMTFARADSSTTFSTRRCARVSRLRTARAARHGQRVRHLPGPFSRRAPGTASAASRVRAADNRSPRPTSSPGGAHRPRAAARRRRRPLRGDQLVEPAYARAGQMSRRAVEGERGYFRERPRRHYRRTWRRNLRPVATNTMSPLTSPAWRAAVREPSRGLEPSRWAEQIEAARWSRARRGPSTNVCRYDPWSLRTKSGGSNHSAIRRAAKVAPACPIAAGLLGGAQGGHASRERRRPTVA